jgi:hypothetical protein
MKFEVLSSNNSEVFETLVSELREFNFSHMGTEKSKHLSVIAKDDNGNIIGGVSGCTIYNQFLRVSQKTEPSAT